jgi:hypothetical protein
MATTTNYGWAEPDNTSLVKNGAQDIRILGDAIDAFLFRPFTRNAIINGGFDIWQRGTSFTGANSNTYTADRWNMYFGTTPTAYTISRQSSGLTGFPYAIRVQRNNGATDTTGGAIGTSIEIANASLLAGQSVTFSFYARKGALFSSASSIIVASLKTGTGTTDANGIYNTYTGQVSAISQNATLTTSWQRFSYTATFGTSVTQAALQFNAGGVGTAGATDYYEIAGVQVEVGNQATPFARAGENIQAELAMCQRYYYRNSDSSTNYASFIPAAITANTTQSDAYLPLPVTMRTKPSSVDFANLQTYDYVAGAGYAISNVTINSNSSPSIAVASLTFAAATAGRFIIVRGNNSASAYLGFSAEL